MTLRDSYTSNMDSQRTVFGASWAAQTFTPSVGYDISYVILKFYKLSSPGTVTVSIKATLSDEPSGDDLCVGTTDGDTLTINSDGEEREIVFTSSSTLVLGTKYAIVVRATGGDGSNFVAWKADAAGASYSGGWRLDSGDSGSNWNDYTGSDHYFKTYDGAYLQPLDKSYTKYQVAFGGNEVWYESTPDTLAEVTAANGDIDTAAKLTAIDAYQKVFVANETNLKVLDFVNTKISTADLGANPPDIGTILTSDGTGNPKMVVEYITALSSATLIYGKRTTTDTFSSGDNITGVDDDNNAISFSLDADEVAPPQWYDWGPYGGDTTNFGTFPTNAYIVVRYRGRLFLAGHPDYPHLWWMTRVARPFDVKYVVGDYLTGLAGNNIDAGEIGDIITAAIPFGDDYMVIGAASSIHLMDGDPAMGGTIDQISETTGIFSQHSWCKDSKGNLYFWGLNGLYKMEGGRSKPQNISEGMLPKLATTWAVNAANYRIVLKFDPLRHGIIICRTTLATGANLNYFYDLKTEGFYPETYPVQCGIMCGNIYDSDSATKALIVGCWDGYTRKFVDAQKNDDIGDTNQAIDAYVTLEMLDLSAEQDNNEGKLISFTVELGGGESGGAFGDSDAVSYDIHVGDDAETCLEHIKDGATPADTGTFTGTGRFRIRPRIRAKWLGIRFYNSTASETFVINSVAGNIVPAGTIK